MSLDKPKKMEIMGKQKPLAGVCCLVFVLALCATSVAADRVGYIDLHRLVNESKMGKAARQDLQKMRKEREAVLARKLRDINDLKEHIQKEGDKMPLQEKHDKIEKLKKLYKAYQRLVADAKEDITTEDRQLVSIILTKANDVVKKVAKQEKYTIILKDPNAIGYLDPDVDITDLVLKELNK